MIRLEALTKEDLKEIVEWNKGKPQDFLIQWAGPIYTAPLTEEQIQKHFDEFAKEENNRFYVYKIVDLQSGKMVGTFELHERDKENKIGRVGRFIIGEESCRGKGIGRAALGKLVKLGFDELKLNKITLGVFDFNIGAIKCYESVGFIKEDYKENYVQTEKGYWNLYDMGITKEQWEINNNYKY